MLTINAARAMGCAEDLGSLEAGKRADLVIRRADAPDAQPGLDPTFQLAALSRTTSVHTVSSMARSSSATASPRGSTHRPYTRTWRPRSRG